MKFSVLPQKTNINSFKPFQKLRKQQVHTKMTQECGKVCSQLFDTKKLHFRLKLTALTNGFYGNISTQNGAVPIFGLIWPNLLIVTYRNGLLIPHSTENKTYSSFMYVPY